MNPLELLKQKLKVKPIVEEIKPVTVIIKKAEEEVEERGDREDREDREDRGDQKEFPKKSTKYKKAAQQDEKEEPKKSIVIIDETNVSKYNRENLLQRLA